SASGCRPPRTSTLVPTTPTRTRPTPAPRLQGSSRAPTPRRASPCGPPSRHDENADGRRGCVRRHRWFTHPQFALTWLVGLLPGVLGEAPRQPLLLAEPLTRVEVAAR